MYYCQETKPIVIEKYPQMSTSDIAIVIGEMWKNIAQKDREYFLNLEIKAKANYEEKVQEWKKQYEENNIVMSEIRTKSTKNESYESSDEQKAKGYSSSKEESQDSEESSVDSNQDDLRTKIGKSRSRTPPFVMSNPALNNISSTSAPELNHRLADLAGGGAANLIANTPAGGIPIPNLNYLPLFRGTQAFTNSAVSSAGGAPGFVLVNPSNIIQPNQMYLQHPGLSSTVIPTANAARNALQQPLLLQQLPLNLRRQLQGGFPGKSFIFPKSSNFSFNGTLTPSFVKNI